MSSSPPSASLASVRNILTLLDSREVQLIAGSEGLERRVTWSCRMRARLPAFESIRGGELALLNLSQLRRIGETLPNLLKSLNQEHVAAVAVSAPSIDALGPDAPQIANQLHLPLIFLPSQTSLEEIERDVINFVVTYRGEIERSANELAHELMQLTIQNIGITGLCQHLANSVQKWVIVQDANGAIRTCTPPPQPLPESLPEDLDDATLQRVLLTKITAPIVIRHEIVGDLLFVGPEEGFGYLERIVLGQVAPILALEVARERERSEVENRYQTEALLDVLQGNYQQTEEMYNRAQLLGYDLSIAQAVVIFELAESEPNFPEGSPQANWGKRLRDELLRLWPGAWVSSVTQRLTVLLPITPLDTESEQTLFTRLERLHQRLQRSQNEGTRLPIYSIGIGRIARDITRIPLSHREALQALEIGQRLFGEGKIHSFARLGIYRLLFHLHGQPELTRFYQETLGPLLEHTNKGDTMLITTLEAFFNCNGNLSETAREMHLHRNSLLYRLGRIEEILGRSLEDAELRLSLQIALKIRHLQPLD